MFFTDVRVPVHNLVGIEGNAFKQTMRQLEHERGGIDRLVSNQAIYQMAVEHADRSDPLIRRNCRPRVCVQDRSNSCDPRGPSTAPSGFSAATKCFCTEHGGGLRSLLLEFLAPRRCGTKRRKQLHMRPGTLWVAPNVMRNILGERVLGLPPNLVKGSFLSLPF